MITFKTKVSLFLSHHKASLYGGQKDIKESILPSVMDSTPGRAFASPSVSSMSWNVGYQSVPCKYTFNHQFQLCPHKVSGQVQFSWEGQGQGLYRALLHQQDKSLPRCYVVRLVSFVPWTWNNHVWPRQVCLLRNLHWEHEHSWFIWWAETWMFNLLAPAFQAHYRT